MLFSQHLETRYKRHRLLLTAVWSKGLFLMGRFNFIPRQRQRNRRLSTRSRRPRQGSRRPEQGCRRPGLGHRRMSRPRSKRGTITVLDGSDSEKRYSIFFSRCHHIKEQGWGGLYMVQHFVL